MATEMNVNKTGQPLSVHRKKSVSFRDRSLLQMFQTSLQTLDNVLRGGMGTLTPTQEIKIREQSLKLCLGCLSYDFIGTSSDESTEDVGTVQIPTGWRSHIENEATLGTLLQTFTTSQPAQSAQALECISQLSSVRRSLFPNQDARQAFLARVLSAVCFCPNPAQQHLNICTTGHTISSPIARLLYPVGSCASKASA